MPIPSKKTLFLTEGTAPSAAGLGDFVVSWTEKAPPEGARSIPSLVETSYSSLQSEYLEWVASLGELQVGKIPLSAYLQIPGRTFSLWHGSLISEKSPLKTHSIYLVLKLRALERLYLSQDCDSLYYTGSDPSLAHILSGWCLNLGHPFHWTRIPPPPRNEVTQPRRRFPGLRQYVRHWGVRYLQLKTRRPTGPATEQGPTIVTYFPNIDLDAARQGRYRSRYWGALHELLEKGNVAVNWVFIYAESPQLTYLESVELRERLAKSDSSARFFLVEEFLDVKSFLWVLGRWILLTGRSLWARHRLKRRFRYPGSQLDLWAALRDDWNSSFSGEVAVDNPFWDEAFQRMSRLLPKGPWGLYLWENQGWEKALVSAWRTRGPSFILGCQHSTLRPFDPRFYAGAKAYLPESSHYRYLPDRLLVSGSGAARLMEANGFPRERLAISEALRYAYLAGAFGQYQRPLKPTGRTLLVACGISDYENRRLLELLGKVLRGHSPVLSLYSRILLKPHPYYPAEPLLEQERIRERVEISALELKSLWPEVDVVLSANSTSVPTEAAWVGIPQICIGSGDSMNLNPLFGMEGAQFVDDEGALKKALGNPLRVMIRPDYFQLDLTLRAWKSALGI